MKAHILISLLPKISAAMLSQVATWCSVEGEALECQPDSVIV